MNQINPNPTNFIDKAINIGLDGKWYVLNKGKWILTKNSPTTDQIKNIIKSQSIKTLIDQLASYIDPSDHQKYTDNCWGSVQYGTAYAFYLCLRIIDFYGDDPIKLLNLHVNLGQPKTLDSIKKALIKRKVNDMFEEYCDPYICIKIDQNTDQCSRASIHRKTLKPAIYNKKIKDAREEMKTDLYQVIDTDFKTMDDYFRYAQDSAWDLWTWLPFVFNALYPHSKIKNVPDSPGFGPEMNVLVQKENYLIGLYAYLLVKHQWITNPDVFCCFDT